MVTRKLDLCPGNARGRRRLRRLYNKRVVLDIESIWPFGQQGFVAALLFPAVCAGVEQEMVDAGFVKVAQYEDSVVYQRTWRKP